MAEAATVVANRSAPSAVLSHTALAVASLLFGANYVIAKVALRHVSPLDLVAVRASGTAVILFAASSVPRAGVPHAPLTAKDFGELFLFSLLGGSINQFCFLAGLSRSTATNASLMLVAIPLLTLAFAVILRRERASARDITGIVIGLAGALLLIVPRGGIALSASAAVGNLLLLGGGCAYALYLVLTRPILTRHDPLRVVSWVFLFSALTVLPFTVSGLLQLVKTPLSAGVWASIAYVVIGATVLPYLLNSWALVHVRASIVAIYILLQPVIATLLGRIYLHEEFAAHTAVAAVLVVAGVVVSGWRRR